MKTEMKKTLFMVAAVALAAAVSCNKEGLGDNGEGQAPSSIVFTAGVETKTTLVDNGDKTYDIHWVNGDAIVVDGVTFTTEDDGAKAFFYTESAFTADNDYYAIYPASAGTSFESITVPAVQTAKAGDFHAAAVVSVAKSATTSLDFKNVTSILKFQVPAPAETVTISSTSAIAGEVSVDYNNGEPAWTAKNTVNEVTVNGPFETGKDYYVAVLPGEKADFEVKLYGKVAKSQASVEVKRSKVMNMGEIPAPELKLYVEDDTDYSALYLYMYDAAGNNTWPGTKITATETVNGVVYKVYTVPADRLGKEYTYIFNNNDNKSQVEENKTIKFNKDNYLRLTKKYSEVVDESNTGKDDPITLYVRNDDNWAKLNYYVWNSSTNNSWPGKSVDMTKKTKIEDNNYYYVELGSHSWNNIIINNGSNQTSDLTIPSKTDDIYVTTTGYIWAGKDQTL